MLSNGRPFGRTAVARMRAAAATALVGLAVAGAGCGPSVRIEPLIGEEPELLEHVATTVPDLRGNPAVQATRALYDALLREDMAAAWELLSAETHAALDEAARTVGASGGRELFLSSPQDGIPLLREGAPPVKARPLQWLLAEDVASWWLTLDPQAPPSRDRDETTVYLVDTSNRYREVRLRREDGGWRVHQPSVRYTDVVAHL